MIRHVHLLAAAGLVAAIGVGGATLSAQGPGRRPAGRQAGLALRALELTEAQRNQVRQLTEQHREQIRPLLERVRTAQESRRQAVEAIPFSEPQIRAAAQALAEAETELAVQRARMQADIYALLTPDQQARLQKMRADREARLKERLGRLQQRGQRRARPQA
jgi:protein CpxP